MPPFKWRSCARLEKLRDTCGPQTWFLLLIFSILRMLVEVVLSPRSLPLRATAGENPFHCLGGNIRTDFE
jgi:hypothetical protein